MDIIEHKEEVRESIKRFIREMKKEHGVKIIKSKDILLSEVFDSAREIGTDDNE